MIRALAARRRPALKLMSLKMLRTTPREAREAAVRRLCATAAMGDGATLCRVLGRYKMFVDDGDFGLAPNLMLDGFWESWVTEAVLARAGEGMVAVDAGANVGYFTLLLADCVGASGHVHVFEPNPRMLDLAGRSVALNGLAARVTLHGRPLGARSGDPVRLVEPAHRPMNAHCVPADPATSSLVTVTLDDVLAGGRADLVKIDVEGAERDVWRGMQRIVARGEPMTILLEFTPDRYADPDGFLAEFAAAGFALSRIDRRRGPVRATAREVLAAPRGLDQMLALVR